MAKFRSISYISCPDFVQHGKGGYSYKLPEDGVLFADPEIAIQVSYAVNNFLDIYCPGHQNLPSKEFEVLHNKCHTVLFKIAKVAQSILDELNRVGDINELFYQVHCYFTHYLEERHFIEENYYTNPANSLTDYLLNNSIGVRALYLILKDVVHSNELQEICFAMADEIKETTGHDVFVDSFPLDGRFWDPRLYEHGELSHDSTLSASFKPTLPN